MGADHSFYVKTIETHARAFLTLNSLALGRVSSFNHNEIVSLLKVYYQWTMAFTEDHKSIHRSSYFVFLSKNLAIIVLMSVIQGSTLRTSFVVVLIWILWLWIFVIFKEIIRRPIGAGVVGIST